MLADAVIIGFGRVWKDENGIVNLRPADGVTLTREMVVEILDTYKFLNGGKKALVLVNVQGWQAASPARDSQVLMASEAGAEVHQAAAFLVDSPVSKIIVNFWIRVHRPLFPTRAFTEKDSAIEWLQGYRD